MVMTNTKSKIDEIRKQLPATTNTTFMNTGSFGPLPQISMEAMASYAQQEFEHGRTFPAGGEVRGKARAAVAQFYNVSPQNIALTRHTTDGMNIGIMGMDWRPGDEIIITDTEHPSGQVPSYNVARRYGVNVRTVKLGNASGDVVGAVEAAITPRSRMLVTSHLTWNTGTVLPMKELTELAHKHDMVVVCDAAQSAGSIPADLADMGVDVYATPGQKWMCGPEGTGAVYVSDRGLERIQPTFTGGSSAAAVEHLGAYFAAKAGAHRYEAGGVTQAAIEGYATSANWIYETVGTEWAYNRIAELGQYAWDKISQLDGVDIVTPKAKMAGLVTFTLEGCVPTEVVAKLAERDIVIRYLGHPVSIRVSTGFYNTEEDIDRTVSALADAQKELTQG